MVEMTGNFIFNYLHDDDKKVFADALGFELLPPPSPTTSLTLDLINAAGNNDADLLDLARKYSNTFMIHFIIIIGSRSMSANASANG